MRLSWTNPYSWRWALNNSQIFIRCGARGFVCLERKIRRPGEAESTQIPPPPSCSVPFESRWGRKKIPAIELNRQLGSRFRMST
jgi:hypothetical protein